MTVGDEVRPPVQRTTRREDLEGGVALDGVVDGAGRLLFFVRHYAGCLCV